MKKSMKISLYVIGAIAVLAIGTFCVLLVMGFRFHAEKAIHSYYRDGTHIHAGEYDFWLNDVMNESGEPVYGSGHVAVRKYGFLYKQLDEKQSKMLIDEYGSYVGGIYRYQGKKSDYYFIHWMQSTTGIVDGKYTSAMRYFTDEIEVNGKTVELFAHCYFELDEEIETLVIKDQTITMVEEYEKPPVSVYAPKPQDTSLEFWITENVGNVDFSQHNEIYGWMCAREFYGKGYSSIKGENGNDVKPLHYVSYLITAYPDYADGGQFVTQIEITDPKVSVYGLTVNSTFEEYDTVFRRMGFIISIETDSEGGHRRFIAEKNDGITFVFYEGNNNDENNNPMLMIKAKVTNREGIQY